MFIKLIIISLVLEEVGLLENFDHSWGVRDICCRKDQPYGQMELKNLLQVGNTPWCIGGRGVVLGWWATLVLGFFSLIFNAGGVTVLEGNNHHCLHPMKYPLISSKE